MGITRCCRLQHIRLINIRFNACVGQHLYVVRNIQCSLKQIKSTFKTLISFCIMLLFSQLRGKMFTNLIFQCTRINYLHTWENLSEFVNLQTPLTTDLDDNMYWMWNISTNPDFDISLRSKNSENPTWLSWSIRYSLLVLMIVVTFTFVVCFVANFRNKNTSFSKILNFWRNLCNMLLLQYTHKPVIDRVSHVDTIQTSSAALHTASLCKCKTINLVHNRFFLFWH